MNNPDKEIRLVKIVPTEEIQEWKKLFSLHGTKTHLENKTGIARKTLNEVLKNEKGVERVIKAIRKYIKQQYQAA